MTTNTHTELTVLHSGWASQWSFSVKIRFTGRMGRRESDVPVCRMMVRKALLFGDGEMARQILAVDEVSSASMGPVKSLGRLVQGEMCFVHISDEKLDFWLDREKGGSWRQVAADVDNP